MRVLQGLKRSEANGAIRVAAPETQGLAGWLLGMMRGWSRQRSMESRQLRLVETLSLGAKRQLMLVTCAGESFLVGGGLENVDTIVRLRAEMPLEAAPKSLDESCG
jgi:flagellar biogenesis protein FliO